MKLKKLFSTVIVMVLLVCYVPALAFAEEYDLAQGSIEVSADESGQYVSQVDAGFVNVTQTSPTIISQSDSETPTQNTISISAADGATAEVTLDGVNIDESGTGNNYNGEGAVTAVSVSTDEDSTVIIELDGENTVKSGRGHAGVENNDSNLVIKDENKVSGSLDATGGAYAAGIGGGYAKDGSNITINSGTVNASGGASGAGIGGGALGNGTNITINGGKVTATGQAAGIGGGSRGKGDNITINDGHVTATGGLFSAGIGGSEKASGTNITINKGHVTATGGLFSAGIGGGENGSGEHIKINGGKVIAKGGGWGSGIGGGAYAAGKDIIINDGNVTATGASLGAGIGGGRRGEGSDIAINGGIVNAAGGEYGAGIGGGMQANGKNITITGGTVNATGGQYGAGIGGGALANGSGIRISGGEVTVMGGTSAASIGGGSDYGLAYKSGDQYRGRGSDVTISGDAHVKVIKNALMIINDGYGNKHGHGAWIGDGGSSDDPIHGTEIEPDTSKLTVNGWVEYWNQYAKEYDHNITGTYVPPEPVLPVASAPEYSPLFRVVDANGADLGHSAVIENGVLTITAAHDFAVLTGALSGVDALMQQGVDTIVFITSGAGSAFELSALRAAGSASDIFRLTHDGEAATLTLGGEALDGVLK